MLIHKTGKWEFFIRVQIKIAYLPILLQLLEENFSIVRGKSLLENAVESTRTKIEGNTFIIMREKCEFSGIPSVPINFRPKCT